MVKISCISRIVKSICIWRKTTGFLQEEYICLVNLRFFLQAVHFNWGNSCSYLNKTASRFSIEPFWQNFASKIVFSLHHWLQKPNSNCLTLLRCYTFLGKMNQKFKFGRNYGYRDMYLEFEIFFSKVFRLDAKPYDAARAVRSHRGKGSGYCYLIGRGPKPCVLSHLNGVLFCFYLKLFLPSIFTSANFLKWYVLHCTKFWVGRYKNFKGWNFLLWYFSRILSSSCKKVQTHKTSNLVYEKIERNSVEQGMFGIKRVPKQSCQRYKVSMFCEKNKTCYILGISMNKVVENLHDQGYLKT